MTKHDALSDERLQRIVENHAALDEVVHVIENNGNPDKCSKEQIKKYLQAKYEHGNLAVNDADILQKTLGFPCLGEDYAYTLTPSEKMKTRRGPTSRQREFAFICEYGFEGFCLCYSRYEKFANMVLSPKLAECYCHKCEHFIGKRSLYLHFDPAQYSIYTPKFILSEYGGKIRKYRGTVGCYVYFVSDQQFVKIGVAENPKDRLGGIQTGNPRECSLLYLIPLDSKSSALSLESFLHEAYARYRMQGEWFDLIGYINHELFLQEFPPELVEERKSSIRKQTIKSVGKVQDAD